MFLMKLKLKRTQVTEQNKKKQTLGGDHIFREGSSSEGDLDADLSPPAHTEEFLPHMHLIVDFLLC